MKTNVLKVPYCRTYKFVSEILCSGVCSYLTVDCGRKPEYPEKTHVGTGKTCKLHTERPQARELHP